MEARKNWKKAFAATLFGIVGLGALGLSLVAIENYRGQKAWEQYQREAAEQGEKLDIADFLPPPSPDEENFAETPFFRDLFSREEAVKEVNAKTDLTIGREGQTKPSLGKANLGIPIQLDEWKRYLGAEDLQKPLANFASLLKEIAEAGERPHARFPINYEEGFLGPRPHLIPVIRLSTLLRLRAEVALSQEKPNEAVADVMLMLRLADVVRSDPSFISELVAIALVSQSLEVVWHGTALNQWDAAELKEIKGRLQRIDLLANMAQALRGERAVAVREWQLIRGNPRAKIRENTPPSYSEEDQRRIRWIGKGPSGWLYQNQVTQFRYYQQVIDALEEGPIMIAIVPFEPENSIWYHGFVKPSVASIIPVVEKAIALQSRVNQGIIAVALAEYRKVNGKYPSTLRALVPQFLAELPVDVLTGDSFVFKPVDDQSYLLYSAGWNCKDDGGKIVMKDQTRLDDLQGDWVWFGTPRNLSTEN